MPRRGLPAVLLLLAARAGADDRPLRAVVDAELRAGWDKQQLTPAPRSADGEFLRRVYLDLVGTIPTHDEAVAFLADGDPKKREKLIDKLLADPRFGTAQAAVWDLVLFGRNPGNIDATRKRDGFKDWLARQLNANVPYNRWVGDLLAGEAAGSELFHVQFRNAPEEATVHVSRIFLGTQLQCARCHDHPYDRWTQKDFYGMTGFFVRVVVQESGGGNARTFRIGEKGTGEVLFSGAAKDQAPGKKGEPVRPRFLGGPDLDEPPAPKPAAKEAAPKASETLPRPAFSRKDKLTAWLTDKGNPYLARAAANRVWAQFMGRGVVHPVDDFQERNEPSHPELLKALTDGFVARDFDLKWLIREVVNTDGYQLALAGRGTAALPKGFERARVRPLSAEEMVTAMRQATLADANLKPGDKAPDVAWDYFLRAFGEPTNGLGDFQGGLGEHLFLNNSEHVRRLITRKPGNLADALLKSSEPVERKVERLYLTVLSRRPNPTESAAVAAYLGQKDKAEVLVEDVIWVLLNGSEFRFNH
ncbi:MAG TPA: DUF1549 domain-containing protein [Urbifossiella sp.]|jgi:hypothetical protein|nr:DUF1549 domain-containing protein [Urbifossiella sp.]